MLRHLLSHTPALQDKLHDEPAEAIEPVSQKSCLFKATLHFSTFLALSFGSGLETLQFMTGLFALNGYLLGIFELTPEAVMAFSALYAVQCMTLNGKYAKEGIEDILENVEGIVFRQEKIFPLASYIYVLSFFINTLATLIDTVGGAYYLELQWGLDRDLTYVMSAIAALSGNGPTEILEAHRCIVDFFTPPRQILKATFKKIQQSDLYLRGTFALKNKLETFWEKIYPYLKDELNKENSQIPTEPDLLASYIINLILNTEEYENNLTVLNISKNKMIKFFLLIDEINQEAVKSADDYQKSCWIILAEVFYSLFKIAIKTGGAIEDLLISYIFLMAAFSELSNPAMRTTALALSTTNLFNDLIFNGNMNSKAIDTFKDAFSGKFSFAKNILFFISVCLGSIISHAEFALLTSLLKKPDATLPAPLPPILPDDVIMVLASFAMLRAGFSDSYYFLKFFLSIGDGIKKFMNNKITPSSTLEDDNSSEILTVPRSDAINISTRGSITQNSNNENKSASSLSRWGRLYRPHSFAFSEQPSVSNVALAYTPASPR